MRILEAIAFGVAATIFSGVWAAERPKSASTQSEFQKEMRDPMQVPVGAIAPSVTTQMRLREAQGDGFRPEQILRIDGRYFTIWQAKRYAVGDRIAIGVIDRITEYDVWIRAEEGLRKFPLYPGIDKRDPSKAETAQNIVPGKASTGKGKRP